MRKTKNYTKFIVLMLIAAIALTMTFGGTRVFADPVTPTPTPMVENGTNPGTVKFTGDDETLTITRIIKDTAKKVVDNQFTYKVEQVKNDDDYIKDAVTGTMPVPTVEFKNDATQTLDTTKNEAKVIKEVALNMNNIQFPKIGDYKFAVTEIKSEKKDTNGDYKVDNSEKYPIDNTKYYIYVSVRNAVFIDKYPAVYPDVYPFYNEETGEPDSKAGQTHPKAGQAHEKAGQAHPKANQPTGYLIATLVDQAKKVEKVENGVETLSGKTDLLFQSNAKKESFDISKVVTGSMADTEQYFKFVININGIGGNTVKYPVNGAHAILETGKTSLTEVSATVTADNKTKLSNGENIVYLKHGQKITITDVPEGTKYWIKEATDATTDVYKTNSDKYKTYIDTSTNDNKVLSEENGKPVTPDDTDNTKFENNYEKATITGVFLDVAPFAALIGLAIFGIVLIRRTSNND